MIETISSHIIHQITSRLPTIFYSPFTRQSHLHNYHDLATFYCQASSRLYTTYDVSSHLFISNPINPSSSQHPWLAACHAFLQGEPHMAKPKLYQTLETFYNLYQPSNATSISGLHSHPILDKLLPQYFVFPWSTHSLASWISHINHVSARESHAHGFKLSIVDGWTWCGPVSEQKVSLEATRLSRVLDSISKNGYKRNNSPSGDIICTLLHNTNQVRLLVLTGQHRLFSLLSLGFPSIPVRILGAINRDDAHHWPNVKRGLFSPLEAVSVFDHYFNSPPLI